MQAKPYTDEEMREIHREAQYANEGSPMMAASVGVMTSPRRLIATIAERDAEIERLRAALESEREPSAENLEKQLRDVGVRFLEKKLGLEKTPR